MDMDFLKRMNITPMLVVKMIAGGVVAVLLLSFLYSLITSSFNSLGIRVGAPMGMTAPSYGVGGFGGGAEYDMAVSSDYYDGGYGSKAGYAVEPSTPQFSTRNAMTSYPAPYPGSPAGNAAEEYEVTDYSVSIETRKVEDTCGAFAELKAKTYVIFENSNTYDRGCNFTFKVEHDNVEEVLTWLKDFDPKDINENVYTIKQQIDDFTSEVDVLTKKRASIDQTLTSALTAYDEITRLATNTQNADALAKIIDSKIGIIERLTQERININEQLDRLARAKADQLDRLEYSFFNVNVYESKYVDGEQLKDSWKAAIREFVQNLNQAIQDVTINLVLLAVLVAQWLLYALIALFVIKYAWKYGKDIWNR